MKIQCPKCGQEYEVDESMSGNRVECQCGERFTAEGKPVKLSISKNENGYNAVISSLICLISAALINFLFRQEIIFCLPFYFVSFVLAGIASAQKRVVAGTFIMIASMFSPLLIPGASSYINRIREEKIIQSIQQQYDQDQIELEKFRREMIIMDKKD